MTPFVVDAAQYIVEPPDMWTSRVAARHREQAPTVVSLPDGGEAWSFEGGAWSRPMGLEVAAGRSPLDIKASGYTYETLREGMYDARERIEDMRIDEVDEACIFPTFGMSVRNIADADLHLACVQAYNDGLWEWVQEGDPRRLLPHALMPAVGYAAAMGELKRVVKKGYRGIVFSGWPGAGAEPQADEDPFWSLCEEAAVVINLVKGGPVGPDRTYVSSDVVPLEMSFVQSASIPNVNLAYFVLAGILDRFPRLRVALIDAGAGWLPFFAELLDWNFRYSRYIDEFASLKHTPGDYVRRQVKATIKVERSAIEVRQDLGVGALMWASNYPKSTSSWPASPLAVRDLLSGVQDDERRRIIGENCQELYGVASAAS